MRNPRLLTLALLALLHMGAARTEQKALVHVNGEPITTADLELYIQANADTAPVPGLAENAPEDLRNAARAEMLQRMINDRVVLQQARARFGDPEQLEGRLDRYAEERVRSMADELGSHVRLFQMLRDTGLTMEQYKRVLAEELLVKQFLWQRVHSKVSVRPAEVRDYYRTHPEQFQRPRTIVYRQILFTVTDEEKREEVRKTAAQVLEKLRDGEGFARLANLHSADADRYPGGLHRVEVPETAPEWRPPVVKGLEPGVLSGIREMAGSYLIVKLVEVQEPRSLAFAEAQQQIRQLLLDAERDRAQSEYVQRLRQRASIRYLPAARELMPEPAR